jgi:hypothetical protein
VTTAYTAGGFRGKGRVPQPSIQGITATLKRVDGSSSAAVFNGALLLPDDHTQDLANVRVLVDGAEPTDFWIEWSDMYHANGTRSTARFAFTYAAANDTNVPVDIRLNETRVNPDAGSSPVDWNDMLTWCRNPRFVMITDPAYVASTKATPLPFVPTSTLTGRANTWLTTERNSWKTAGAGTASYDHPAVNFYAALAEGNIDDAIFAIRQWASNGAGTTEEPVTTANFSFRQSDPAWSYPNLDLNPANYSGASNQLGVVNEQNSGFPVSNTMVYQLTGFEYGRYNNAQYLAFSSGIWPNNVYSGGGRAVATGDTPRLTFRWYAHHGAMNYYHRETRTIFTPFGFGFTNSTATLAQRWSTQKSKWQTEETTANKPSWFPGIWGQGMLTGSQPASSVGTFLIPQAEVDGAVARVGNGTCTVNSLDFTDNDTQRYFGGEAGSLKTGKFYRAVCTTVASGGGTFTVYDQYDRVKGTVTVGTPWTTAGPQFTITAGGVDFALNDTFYFGTLRAPAFQLIAQFACYLHAYWSGLDQSAALLDQLDLTAQYVVDMMIELNPPGFGRTVYGMPYGFYDPAQKSLVALQPLNTVYSTTLAFGPAWMYARGGHVDTALKAMYEACADIDNVYFRVNPDGTTQAQSAALKEYGEFWQLAYFNEYLIAGGSPTP